MLSCSQGFTGNIITCSRLFFIFLFINSFFVSPIQVIAFALAFVVIVTLDMTRRDAKQCIKDRDAREQIGTVRWLFFLINATFLDSNKN